MAAFDLYDNVIFASGEGGKYLAWHLAQSGQSTVVIERQWIGGSCPNMNCLPSKNEIWSAKVAQLMQHASEFGVHTDSVSINIAAVRDRIRQMVNALISINRKKYEDPGDKIFLNLGTHASVPPVPNSESVSHSPTLRRSPARKAIAAAG
jgi:pyruvate/2-oxoglutarate dehydrogenase complex dihydrolipoamide dehydrogenase (E3) component